VGEKNRLKAKRAGFLSESERRVKPETEQLLTRWGKSCVFSEPTDLSFFKHLDRPILSTPLEGRTAKAKSPMVASSIPKNLFIGKLKC